MCTYEKFNGTHDRIAWPIRAAGLLLAVVTFTPAVIPMGADSPRVLQMPVTLWAGGLVSLGFLALTVAAVLSRPARRVERVAGGRDRTAEAHRRGPGVTSWFAVLGPIYVAALAYAAIRARRDTKSDADFLMAGSQVGIVLGFLSFSATLFSTFTLLGMPDFFRQHGVGAWVFLGVTDAALAFVLLWFGLALRRHAKEHGFSGVSNLIVERCGDRRLGFLYLASLFIFIVPYVAVQVRGIGFFLHGVFPSLLPYWGWAVLIVVVLLVYSEVGGLRAIMYSDALQGVVLLGATWLIAARCIGEFGSVQNLIAAVERIEPALLSTPGPQGLFDTQFLVASFLAMALLPMTQPQLTTRIVIMKDGASFDRMAIAVCVFSLLVVAPTLPIGFYGAVEFGGATSGRVSYGGVGRSPARAACGDGLGGSVGGSDVDR